MANNQEAKAYVPALSKNNAKIILGQILSRKDENHPHSSGASDGFFDILENRKPEISASKIFIKKVSIKNVSKTK